MRDVALGVDDEAGAERLANAATVIQAVFAILATTAAEEAVKEVLEILAAGTLIVAATTATAAAIIVAIRRVRNGSLAGMRVRGALAVSLTAWAKFPC